MTASRYDVVQRLERCAADLDDLGDTDYAALVRTTIAGLRGRAQREDTREVLLDLPDDKEKRP